MGAEVVTCKFRVSLIFGEASRKVLRATLLPEVRMRTAITVAIVLVGQRLLSRNQQRSTRGMPPQFRYAAARDGYTKSANADAEPARSTMTCLSMLALRVHAADNRIVLGCCHRR
jgi:hypothetical protein